MMSSSKIVGTEVGAVMLIFVFMALKVGSSVLKCPSAMVSDTMLSKGVITSLKAS